MKSSVSSDNALVDIFSTFCYTSLFMEKENDKKAPQQTISISCQTAAESAMFKTNVRDARNETNMRKNL